MEAFRTVFFHLLLAALWLPWLVVTAQLAANADNLWLVEAFSRWAAGARMTDAAYEPNPPLALLLYALPAGLSGLTGLALHHAIFIYTLAAVFLSALAVRCLLSLFDFLAPGHRTVILYSYVTAVTVMTTGYFGERDHFVALALVPFVLMQVALLCGASPPPRFFWIVAFAAAPFILLKPAHGLLPALLLAARLAHTRDWRRAAVAPDFIALSTAVLGYGALLLWVFPDYLREIFPAVLRYYLPARDDGAVLMMAGQYAAGAAMTGFLCARRDLPRPLRLFTALLAAGVVVGLVPYILQGHGYYYHLLPATAFLWMGLGLAAACFLERERLKTGTATVLTCLVIIALAYVAKPMPGSFTHVDFSARPLVQAAKECDQPRCRVLIFSPRFEMSYLIAYYAGAEYASRFPAFFFLPAAVSGRMPVAEAEKFSLMVAEDLARYRPDTVMIASFPAERGQKGFDFISYFSATPAFAQAWRGYEKSGVLEAPLADYIIDPYRDADNMIPFTIYKRSGP